MNKIISTIKNIGLFKEEFAQVWTLLNDTENFLKRFSLFDEYENRLRIWRETLNSGARENLDIHNIKSQIVSFRKDLRLRGYDLRLSSMDIVIIGHRNDDAPRYGFRRACIILELPKIYWLSGEENHIELARHLSGLCQSANFSHLHNIWFRWNSSVLEIAAADSESEEQFVKMKDFLVTNKLFALSSLKNLR